jgi:hypothetical protein
VPANGSLRGEWSCHDDQDRDDRTHGGRL